MGKSIVPTLISNGRPPRRPPWPDSHPQEPSSCQVPWALALCMSAWVCWLLCHHDYQSNPNLVLSLIAKTAAPKVAKKAAPKRAKKAHTKKAAPKHAKKAHTKKAAPKKVAAKKAVKAWACPMNSYWHTTLFVVSHNKLKKKHSVSIFLSHNHLSP